jgi:lipopolysaccharide/colanic/teichoic acid biosynthesis glycosyltransferase
MRGFSSRFQHISPTVLCIFVAVTSVAIGLEGHSPALAIFLGLSATLIGAIIEPLDRDAGWNSSWFSSPVMLIALALVLAVAWDLGEFGLAPAHAIIAALAAGIAGTLISALRKRVVATPRPSRVLIVGSGSVAAALSAAFAEGGRALVVGCLDDSPGEGVLGCFDELERVAMEQRVHLVAFAYARANDERLAAVARRCRELDIAIAVVPRLFEHFDTRTRLRRIAGMPLLVVDPLPHEVRTPALSRVFDIAFASGLLVLTLPVWLLIALAVVIDERGPVLYRARRVGRDGREFDMLKFRKMRRDASGGKLTLIDDDRLTRVGRFLTRTKLDELPQLVNVLRGDMALVGPRPEDPIYVALYPDEFAEIHRCRPGITGLSQIQYRDEAPLLVGDDFEELYRNELLPKKIDLDRYYASRRCLALDLRILVWTGVAIFAGAHVHRHALTRSVRFQRFPEPSAEADPAPAKMLEIA